MIDRGALCAMTAWEYAQLLNETMDNRSRTIVLDDRKALSSLSRLDAACIVLYSLLMVSGLACNVWVLRVVFRALNARATRSTGGMPVYIVALTGVNVLVLCALPLTIADLAFGEWRMPGDRWLCVLYWLVELSNKQTALFVLAPLTFSCYLAVCRPGLRRLYGSRRLAGAVVLLSFLLTLAVNGLFILRHVNIYYLVGVLDNGTVVIRYGRKCLFQATDHREEAQFAMRCFICGYAVPALLMFLCYGAILRRVGHGRYRRRLHQHERLQQQHQQQQKQMDQHQLSVPRRKSNLSLVTGHQQQRNGCKSPSSPPVLVVTSTTGATTTPTTVVVSPTSNVSTFNLPSRFWRVVKCSSILVVFYLVSWTPYWALTLAIMRGDRDDDEVRGQRNDESNNSGLLANVALIVHLFPYVNVAFSPLLYTLLNKQIRSGLPRKRTYRPEACSWTTIALAPPSGRLSVSINSET